MRVSTGNKNPLWLSANWACDLGLQLNDEVVELLLGASLAVISRSLLELDPLKHV
jgi:hypothetical protein